MTTTDPFDLDAIEARAAMIRDGKPFTREWLTARAELTHIDVPEMVAGLRRLVAELERTEGDLAVAVREAGTARAERDAALAAVQAVREVHSPRRGLDLGTLQRRIYCGADCCGGSTPYPCRTVAALGTVGQPQEDPDGK